MEKKSITELRKALLENKIIEIKPIIRRKSYLKKNHDGHHTYTGCHKGFTLFFDADRRSYKNPFQERKDGLDEQDAFERLLDKKEGSLNLYNFKLHEENFWGSFEIFIPKDGIKLDLTSPADLLRYRIILVDPKFAKNKEEASILEKQYEVVSESDVKERVSELAKKKDKAQDHFFKIKKSSVKMRNALRLMNKRPDKDAKLDWLKSQLFEIIEETTVPKGVAGLDKFLQAMEDPTAETKLFVLDLLESRDIVKTDIGFKVAGTNNFVGTSFVEIVRYFLKDNPDARELKVILEEKLKVS